jgi:hypothetical protein
MTADMPPEAAAVGVDVAVAVAVAVAEDAGYKN